MVRLSLYRDFADSAAEARLALADNGTVAGSRQQCLAPARRDAGTVAGVDISSLLHIPLHTLLAAEGPLEIQVGRGQSVYARLEERPHAKTRTAGGPRPLSAHIGAQQNRGPSLQSRDPRGVTIRQC